MEHFEHTIYLTIAHKVVFFNGSIMVQLQQQPSVYQYSSIIIAGRY